MGASTYIDNDDDEITFEVISGTRGECVILEAKYIILRKPSSHQVCSADDVHELINILKAQLAAAEEYKRKHPYG